MWETKHDLCMTLVEPILTYGGESQPLKCKDENML
jgi:hypothetical protein